MRIQIDASGSPEQVGAEVVNSVVHQVGLTPSDAEKQVAEGIVNAVEVALESYRAVDTVRVLLSATLEVSRV